MTTPEAEYSASVDDGHLDTKRPLRGASERKKRPGKMPGSFFGKGLFRGREATPSSARITGGDAPSPPKAKRQKNKNRKNVSKYQKSALTHCLRQRTCALPGAAPLLAIGEGRPPRFALPPPGAKTGAEDIPPEPAS